MANLPADTFGVISKFPLASLIVPKVAFSITMFTPDKGLPFSFIILPVIFLLPPSLI